MKAQRDGNKMAKLLHLTVHLRIHLHSERPERGGPCWLLKLRWTGTQNKLKGSSLVHSLGSSCLYKRLLPCLGCLGQPTTNNFFPHRTLFQFMCPHLASNLGRQSCRAACLWMYVSGCTECNQRHTLPTAFKLGFKDPECQFSRLMLLYGVYRRKQ